MKGFIVKSERVFCIISSYFHLFFWLLQLHIHAVPFAEMKVDYLLNAQISSVQHCRFNRMQDLNFNFLTTMIQKEKKTSKNIQREQMTNVTS